MTQLDPRLNAYREDLAAAALQDRVRAARYAEGELRQVAAPTAPIRVAPRFDAPLATEALSGELLTVYEFRDGWAWVQLHDDGYVGYTTVDCLSGVVEENTHRVSARLTNLYPSPDIKRPPITKLAFSCTVAPVGVLEGRFVEVSRGGFIFADHLVGIRERVKDFVRVAEQFVGAPYLWGGKTVLGIDCSGLVQIALRAAGIPCLRDSDMQMQSAGEPLDHNNLDAIQRGDLLFWNGHVAIAQSADWMVHASGHHMQVVVEPIRRALERTAELNGPLLAILRPPVPQQQPEQQWIPVEQKSAAIAQQPPAAEPAIARPSLQQKAAAPLAAALQAPAAAQAPKIAPAATAKAQPAAPAPAQAPKIAPAATAKAQPAAPAPAQAPKIAPAATAKAQPAAPAAPSAKKKEQAPIDLAAKTLAAQIHASMSAQKGRSEKPAEPERNRGQSTRPGEKPKQAG